MRKPSAVAGSVVFFALAPGVAAGLGPWLLSGWRWGDAAGPVGLTVAVRVLGALLIAAGLPVLVAAFVRFVTEGLGTPAPVAPPERLVVGGLFRYVRNPMYVAVTATILGQGLLLWQPVLLIYGLVAGLAMFTFVKVYEEPHLTEQFGEPYREYRRRVPGWWPRLRPWQPDS